MKATGIVRRIDDYVKIGLGQKALKTGVSLILSVFAENAPTELHKQK